MSNGLYEADFYRWSVEQVRLLALGQFDGLDLVNLADEIGSLGREAARSLLSVMTKLLAQHYGFTEE